MVNYAECAKAELEPESVERLGRRLERLARECQALGIQIFGGAGVASLRFDDGEGRPLILAHLSTTNVLIGRRPMSRNDNPLLKTAYLDHAQRERSFAT